MFAASKSGSAAEATDAQFNYVTMLLHGDGTNGAQNNTFVDSSTNNFTITRNGNTTQGTFSPYGSNWSNYFDGSGDYLQAGTSANLALGSGDFTIEGWFFCTGYNGGAALYSTINTYPSSTGLLFYISNLGVYTIDVNGTILTGSGTATLNTWVHYAVVRNSNTITIYINGSSIGTVSSSTNYSDQYAVIGRTGAGSASNYFLGYISNTRMVKGTAVYTSSFIPSTTPLTAITNTQLLTCQSNRFIDTSSNAFTITKNGDTSVQRFSPFSPTSAYSTSVIGGSGYFDGSGDYLTASQNAAFNFGTGAFTVEAWVYITASNGTNQRIIGLGDGAIGGGPYTGWSFNINNNLSTINWYRYDGTETDLSASYTFKTNTWYHIVAVRNGSSNLSMFVNGTRVYNNTGSSITYSNVNSDPLYVGLTYDGAGGGGNKFFNGYMASARIVAGSAVYDPSSSTLTIPTAPPTAITNTSFLLNYTNAGILDNAMMNDLETVGNAQISTSVKKYGTGSLAFDGSGDYLTIPSSPNLGFGSGDFTVEAWVYLTANIANAAGGYLIDFRGGSTNNFALGFIGDSSVTKMYEFVGSGGASATGTATVTLNTWNHVAYVRNGTTVTMYLNGTANGTMTSSYSQGSTSAIISARYTGATEYITGYIDDLRITKGVARYTANFTAPTAAFPDKG